MWHSLAFFRHNFSFPLYAAPFQWRLLIYIGKNLWCRVLEANKKQVPRKILSGNKNQFCQSNIFGSFSNLKPKGCAHVLLGKGSGKIWTCSCWEKGNFIMINEFKYGQAWKIWPSPLTLSLYNPFKYVKTFSVYKLKRKKNIPWLNSVKKRAKR